MAPDGFRGGTDYLQTTATFNKPTYRVNAWIESNVIYTCATYNAYCFWNEIVWSFKETQHFVFARIKKIVAKSQSWIKTIKKQLQFSRSGRRFYNGCVTT